MKRVIIVVCLLLCCKLLNATTIRINEVMPSNGWTIKSEWGENSDWLELYNYGSEPINLAGYRINDRYDFENAYVLPDTILNPNEYMLIWASGRDTTNSNILSISSTGLGLSKGENFEDSGSFTYVEVEGDFEAVIRITDFTADSPNAAGIFMLRENLSAQSRWAGMGFDKYSSMYNGYNKTKHFTEHQLDTLWYQNIQTYVKINMPLYWIKLIRTGDYFEYYVSYDNYKFISAFEISIPNYNNKAYLGIFLYSTIPNQIINTKVTEFKINNNIIESSLLKFIDYTIEQNFEKNISNEIHTDFSLNAEEEGVYLWSPNQEIIDFITWTNAVPDISLSKKSSVSTVFYEIPTPGKQNNIEKSNILNPPIFSVASGYYSKTIKVEIISKDNADIYYTLDFSEPTTNSIKYVEPIIINTTTIIRAISYKKEAITSNIATQTYLFDKKGNLPTISMVIPESKLYDEYEGILYEIRDEKDEKVIGGNIFKKMESAGNFEFINKKNELEINKTVGYRIRGAGSRNFLQKSFNVKTGSRYKSDNFNYKFFREKEIDKFSNIVLRNSGHDFRAGFIRDALTSVIAINSNLNIETQAYLASRVYLNGEYYGMLNIREKSNEEFLELNYGYSSENITILNSSGVPVHNSSESYLLFTDSLHNSNTSIDSIFNVMYENIDIENLIEYYIIKIFFADRDWPFNNNRIWRSTKPPTKWRHILFDSDMGMAWYLGHERYDSFAIIFDSNHVFTATILFRKAMENINFRNKFLNRFADLMNTKFKAENTIPILDSLYKIIKDEMPRICERWNCDIEHFNHNIKEINNFLNTRCEFLFNEILLETFELPGLQKINLSVIPPNSGKVGINTIPFLSEPFEGYYFQTVPITFYAKPQDGFTFIGWSLQDSPPKNELNYTPDSPEKNIIAYFKKITTKYSDVVINEIMYREYPGTQDWCELYNNTDYIIDLSNWVLKDDNVNNIFVFPDSTYLFPYSYLVVAQDIDDFKMKYPNVNNVIGSFEFGLGRNDQIRLYNNFGELIDSVDYHNDFPWYPETDGTGYSLELISPDLDNTLPENWQTSYENLGTPGRKNSVYNSDFYNLLTVHYDEKEASINIKIQSDTNFKVKIYVTDITGREYTPLRYEGYIEHNINYIDLSTKVLRSGLYLVNFEFSKGNNIFTETKKIVILR